MTLHAVIPLFATPTLLRPTAFWISRGSSKKGKRTRTQVAGDCHLLRTTLVKLNLVRHELVYLSRFPSSPCRLRSTPPPQHEATTTVKSVLGRALICSVSAPPTAPPSAPTPPVLLEPQLIQTAVDLSRVGVANNNITACNVMLQREEDDGGVSYRTTLMDFGLATVLSVRS